VGQRDEMPVSRATPVTLAWHSGYTIPRPDHLKRLRGNSARGRIRFGFLWRGTRVTVLADLASFRESSLQVAAGLPLGRGHKYNVAGSYPLT